MPPRLRVATHDDIPALHALVESAYRGDSAKRGWTHEADLLDGQRVDQDRLHEILGDPRETIVLAHETGGVLIGCVQVTMKSARTGHLGMLSVDPLRQADGLGKTLIAAAEAHARAAGALAMEMTVIKQRRELIAFYERRGYRWRGREAPFPYGEPRFGLPKRGDLVFVVLEKDLL